MGLHHNKPIDTHLTATKIKEEQKIAEEKLCQWVERIRSRCLPHLVKAVHTAINEYEGLCPKCITQDKNCPHCGGTGVNREILRG